MISDVQKRSIQRYQGNIDKVPPEVLESLQGATQHYFSLEEGVQKRILERVIQAIISNETISPEQIASDLAIPDVDAGSGAAIIAFHAGAARNNSIRSETSAQIFAQKLDLLSFHEKISSLFEEIDLKRNEINLSLNKDALANELIPTFSRVVHTIDLRLRFDKNNNLRYSSPVAVVQFETDVGSDLLLQFTPKDIENLANSIEMIKARLQKASDAASLIDDRGA